MKVHVTCSLVKKMVRPPAPTAAQPKPKLSGTVAIRAGKQAANFLCQNQSWPNVRHVRVEFDSIPTQTSCWLSRLRYAIHSFMVKLRKIAPSCRHNRLEYKDVANINCWYQTLPFCWAYAIRCNTVANTTARILSLERCDTRKYYCLCLLLSSL